MAALEYEGAVDAPVCKPDALKLAINVAQKVGLPDYSSIDASLHVSGITVATSDAEVEALVARGKIVFGVMAASLHDKVAAAKRERGWQ